VRPHPTAPFHPHGDTATYRDLLLFEERLKMNAEMLRKRRRRYNSESAYLLCAASSLEEIYGDELVEKLEKSTTSFGPWQARRLVGRYYEGVTEWTRLVYCWVQSSVKGRYRQMLSLHLANPQSFYTPSCRPHLSWPISCY
jgi:hypothetical protein